MVTEELHLAGAQGMKQEFFVTRAISEENQDPPIGPERQSSPAEGQEYS